MWTLPDRIIDVEWHTVSSEFGERLSDGRVFHSPVRLHADDIEVIESFLDVLVVQGDAFVHLTRDTPGRGEVDKYGAALSAKLSDFLF